MSVKVLTIGFNGKKGSGKDTVAAFVRTAASKSQYFVIRRGLGDALREEVADFLLSLSPDDALAFLDQYATQDEAGDTMLERMLAETFAAEPQGWWQKICAFFGQTYLKDYRGMQREVLIEWLNDRVLKEDFRALCQWWGTEYRRKQFSERYWLDKFLEFMEKEIATSNGDGLGWAGMAQPLLFLIPDVRFHSDKDFVQKELEGYCIRIDRPECNEAEKGKNVHWSETALDDAKDFNLFILNNQTLADLETVSKVAFLNAVSWKWGNAGNPA